MSCACGHHHDHHHHHADQPGGDPVALARPMIGLTGRLICADAAQMVTALTLLPDHVALSRAEPGCLRFDLHQADEPGIWHLSELFSDADAFAAHQARNAASAWGQQSGDLKRDFTRGEAQPVIHPERTADWAAIGDLLRAAFGGGEEAALVAALRRDGDLDLSLVAHHQGTILGHVALSPVAAPFPALALAPVAILPAMQKRGLGGALIRAAQALRPDHTIIVLGDPAYYGRFGFRPVAWDSPYAGPYLQAIGPHLPARATIRHAPAFAGV